MCPMSFAFFSISTMNYMATRTVVTSWLFIRLFSSTSTILYLYVSFSLFSFNIFHDCLAKTCGTFRVHILTLCNGVVYWWGGGSTRVAYTVIWPDIKWKCTFISCSSFYVYNLLIPLWFDINWIARIINVGEHRNK